MRTCKRQRMHDRELRSSLRQAVLVSLHVAIEPGHLTYLEEQPGMGISQVGSRIAVKCETLNSQIEVIELLGEEECPNQHAIPATAFVRQCGETFRADPFYESNEGRVGNAFIHSNTELSDRLLLQGLGNQPDFIARTCLLYALIHEAKVAASRPSMCKRM